MKNVLITLGVIAAAGLTLLSWKMALTLAIMILSGMFLYTLLDRSIQAIIQIVRERKVSPTSIKKNKDSSDPFKVR